MRKLLYLKSYLILVISLLTVSCNHILDQEPDKILTNDKIFGDEIMIKSVLANYYGRVHWGQNTESSYNYTILDEAGKSDGGADNMNSFGDALFRVYDYNLIRNINEFLEGLRSTNVLSVEKKMSYEAEARFLRAWVYFNMARSLGGMPIVGDKVFAYSPGDDITLLQIPRSTEEEMYNYIISELDEINEHLGLDPTINASRVNKWGALMLKARAAIYAASIANYNNKMTLPIKTQNGEVGIPANAAQRFYEIALDAAEKVINSGKYSIAIKKQDDLSRNYYEAINFKENNSEVIWARDYIYPGQTVGFTRENIPPSHAEDIDRAYSGPILNIVEAFEYTNNRDGSLLNKDGSGNYIFYDNPLDIFHNKDARLAGTVILPGSTFKGDIVTLQAGHKVLQNGVWVSKTSDVGKLDENNNLITAANGPIVSNVQYVNKTGFFYRKFMDENAGASTRGKNSAMWFPRFRIAEAYLIASEAALELTRNTLAIGYLNTVRNRAGLNDLTSLSLDDIVQERRVEFAFEDHRYWDLKRWRIAHIVWDGISQNKNAMQYSLFPYKIVEPSSPNNGKWVFDKQLFVNSPNARFFQLKNYYNFIDQGWINNNPKIVKNPFQ